MLHEVMNRIGFLFSLIGVLACFSSSAGEQKKQNKADRFVIEAQYSAGKLFPMYHTMPKTTFTNAGEIFLGYQTDGEKQWNKIFNYPRMGMTFLIQDLGNNRIFGQQFSFVPTVYFSTAKKENAKFYAEIRYGLGMAVFNRPYDSLTNHDNALAGSYTSWQYTVGANMRWQVSRYISLQLGGVWYHASNAHTQLPNVGVNNFAVYVGLLTYPFGKKPRTHENDSLPFEKKWHVNFRFGSGWQEMGGAFGPAGGKKYPVYTAAIYAGKRVAKIFYMKAGAIYRYYPMYEEFNRQHNVFSKNPVLHATSFTLFIGNEFLLGHFSISLEAGINVYKPAYKAFYNYYEKSTAINYYTKQYITTRFGLNYYVFDPYSHLRNNVFVGAYVSANTGQAEFLELNLGYVF